MFTGIIVSVGTVQRIRGSVENGLSLDIRCTLGQRDLEIGASVSCNGVCLTVVECQKLEEGPDGSLFDFTVDVSPETLSVTHIGNWLVGQRLNLEAALRLGDALGGHWVTGHVDGLGSVQRVEPAGDQHERWFIACPETLMRYIAPRGSVAVDGCSLTVVEVGAGYFAFNMIPHTRAETSFHSYANLQPVHLEVDILARYAARWKETGDD